VAVAAAAPQGDGAEQQQGGAEALVQPGRRRQQRATDRRQGVAGPAPVEHEAGECTRRQLPQVVLGGLELAEGALAEHEAAQQQDADAVPQADPSRGRGHPARQQRRQHRQHHDIHREVVVQPQHHRHVQQVQRPQPPRGSGVVAHRQQSVAGAERQQGRQHHRRVEPRLGRVPQVDRRQRQQQGRPAGPAVAEPAVADPVAQRHAGEAGQQGWQAQGEFAVAEQATPNVHEQHEQGWVDVDVERRHQLRGRADALARHAGFVEPDRPAEERGAQQQGQGRAAEQEPAEVTATGGGGR
jgi:hypothetical protein